MNMSSENKILIYCHIQLWPIHLAEVIEIALKYMKKNKKVVILYCEGDLNSCPANPQNKPSFCKDCIYTTRYIKNRILDKCESITLKLNSQIRLDLSHVHSVDQLRELKYHNFPIGELLLSQLVDNLKDCYFDLCKHKELLESWGTNGISLYNSMAKIFQEESFDKVYIWNGRRVSDGPVYYAAVDHFIDAEVFISGGKRNTFMTLSAPYVHHLDTHKSRILEVKAKISRGEITDYQIEAKKFFYNQRFGLESFPGFVHFAKNFSQKYSLPDQPNILIFTSSYFEYFSMKDYIGGIFDNHYDGLQELLTDSSLKTKFNIIVRWHPNLSNAGEGEQSLINEIIEATSGNRVRHFKATDRVDSYSLLEIADIVLSFGSTIGIEAAYYGKPSILLGRQWYEDLNCIIRPKSYSDLVNMLHCGVSPLPNDDALVYGFYMRSYGQHSFENVKFLGTKNTPFVQNIPLQPRSILIKNGLKKTYRMISSKSRELAEMIRVY